MAILDDDVNEVKNVNEQEIKMDSYIKKIIETNKEYVKNHPELPKAGLTSHPTKN